MLKRKLHRSGPVQTAVITASALLLVTAALLVFLQSPSEAQGNDKATSNLAVTSPNPGELAITWDAPGNAPDDYRVTWKKSTAKWPSHRSDNTVEGGNAFPTGTSYTVTGLEEGTAYQARVRARYHNSGGKAKTDSTNVESVTMKNGRPATKAVCMVCGAGKYRIGATPAETS